MKKGVCRLAALALCAGMLWSGPVCRAGWVEPAVTVQLNGQTVEFPDAQPVVKNDRTFLPFYAVFHTLGAEIRWSSEEPDKVVAIRNGRTVTMTNGSREVTVEENGETTVLTMDVAPYIDNATDRTYVPLYFAAAALDCMVGWDSRTCTAIIVDPAALAREVMEGGSYTHLEKLAAFPGTAGYRSGIWDMEARGMGSVSMYGMDMPMTVTATGTIEGEKLEMTTAMAVDMTELARLFEQARQTGGLPEGVVPEKMAAMSSGIITRVRQDPEKGILYQNMSGALMKLQGVDEEVWYSCAPGSTLARMGAADWTGTADLREAVLSGDGSVIARYVLKTVGLTDSETSYQTGKVRVEELMAALTDEHFTEEDGLCRWVWNMEGETEAYMELSFAREEAGIVSCTVTLTERGEDLEREMVMTLGKAGEMTAELSARTASGVSYRLELEGKRSPGTEPPRTAPDEGERVEPYENLFRVKDQ